MKISPIARIMFNTMYLQKNKPMHSPNNNIVSDISHDN